MPLLIQKILVEGEVDLVGEEVMQHQDREAAKDEPSNVEGPEFSDLFDPIVPRVSQTGF